MKKYTFKIKNNPSTFNCPFYDKCNKSTDYSKILDDLINADIAEKNPWLFGNNDNTTTTSGNIKITLKNKPTNNLLGEIHAILNKKDEYDDYINYINTFDIFNLCNMYIPKKLYKTTNGDSFMILDDAILINGKMFFFDDLNNNTFIDSLNSFTKKTIATIYVAGLKITIKK